jgi:hypothetical protein
MHPRTVHLKADCSRHNPLLSLAPLTSLLVETATAVMSDKSERNEQADLPSQLKTPTRTATDKSPTVTGSQCTISRLNRPNLDMLLLPHLPVLQRSV